MTNRRLSTIPQAAKYASCSPKTIRRRIADGSLTGYRFGPRVLRVDLNELDAAMRPIPTVRGGAA
ncbi:helix-turn-helix domain-containing protein [Dermacoccaceae bacterium W4C1]